jgi:hypothetical protein
MNNDGEEFSDFDKTEFKYPKTVEGLLADIAYKEKVKGIVEVEIVMSTEFIQDLCQRLLTLEKSLSKGIRL